MYFSNIRVLLAFLIMPFAKMEKIDVAEYLQDSFHQKLLADGEFLLSAYDNPFNSFLITNTRIIGILKVKVEKDSYVAAKIFSIPLFQVGTMDVFYFRFPSFNALQITTSPGFIFHWFFKKNVSVDTLSNELSKVIADVQIDGGSKLRKL